MLFKKVRSGQLVFDKLSRKTCVVEGVSEDSAILSVEESGEKLRMTPENAICFRFLHDPNPLDIPAGEWSVKDGKLMVDGEPATEEQGQLSFNEVVGLIPGAVIVSAKTLSGEEDREDIFKFLPDDDRFFKEVSRIKKGSYELKPTGFGGLLIHQSIVKTMTPDPDNPEKEIEREALEDGGIISLRATHPKKTLTFARPFETESVTLLSEHDMTVGIKTRNVLDPEGFVAELDGYDLWMVFTVDNSNYMLFEQKTPRDDESFIIQTKNPEMGSYTIIGSDFITGWGDEFRTPLLNGHQKFKNPVDVSHGDHKTILTLADDEYNVLRIARESTKDRGYIYTIL